MGQDRLALPIHCHGVAPRLLRSRHFRPLHGLIFQLPSVLPLPLHARQKDGDRRMETEGWRQKDRRPDRIAGVGFRPDPACLVEP